MSTLHESPENSNPALDTADSPISQRQYDALLKFARLIFEVCDWPEGNGLDAEEVRDAALQCELLVLETRTQPCGENCFCAAYHGDISAGIICYRKSPILLGK